MLHGSFLEAPTDEHVRRRESLVASRAVHPPPRIGVRTATARELPGRADTLLGPDLRESGLAVVKVDQPLTNEQFRAVGAVLGEAIPESDPTVLPHVEDGTILNLIPEYAQTDDAGRAPFARNFLSLHTESSGRAVAEQPRYIVLMCLSPGDQVTAAQTVLVPMDEVASQLTPRQAAIIANTRYRHNESAPMILRTVGGRAVFSFRDFLSQPLHWTHTGTESDPEQVNEALRTLLVGMYSGDAVVGVHWTPGLLVVLDNTFYFHGRTAASTGDAVRNRHLKRLRIA